ncbi:MAG TPA: serine/threonine-protein kinase [Ktedonobacteraceae bacterium]
MLSLEGKQLGNYDVIRRIRVGGMGAVYEGRQRTAFDRRVAIKVILGNYAEDRDMRRRFAREARTVARLHHPHILPLIEFGDEQGILYLVMPFIDGGTLTSYLRRSLPPLGEVAAIYQQLLDAVEYAHDEGLIHRDIKSSNVLLEMRRSGPPYVYLADFGLVRTLRQAESEQAGKPIPLDQVPGTPHYMAPEQTRGIVTPQTDIYALGVLLYQLLTGDLPYNDPDDISVIQMHLNAPIPRPSTFDSSIPTELDEVVSNAMAKRQEARYKTVAELRRAFLAAINGPIETLSEEAPQELPGPGAASRHLPTSPLSQDAPAPNVIPRRLGSRALHPLPPPAHPSTKLAPRVPADARPRNVGTRDLNARDGGMRNAKGRNVGTRNLEGRNARARDAALTDAQTRNNNSRNTSTRALDPGARDINLGAQNNANDVGARFISPSLANPSLANPSLANPSLATRDLDLDRRDNVGARLLNPSPAYNSARTTDDVQQRPRTTEEPIRQRRKRAHVALFAGIVVPAILLILLIMPRVLGISLFPVGFPLFGTPPVATILITAQSKTVQDKYVLTASPQVKVPDLNSHAIPAVQLRSSISAKRTAQTNGTKTIPGLQARGTVELINNGNAPAFVAAQTTLTTASGIQFQTVQDAQIPAHTQNNTINVTVIAVAAGAAGNIPAFTLNGPCCGDGITVKNNVPFSGGVDAQTAHTVAQADLNSVQNALVPNLERQLNQQLQKSLTSDETSVGTPIYSVSTTSDNAIDVQADNVQVTVTVTGTLIAYNRTVASSTATQLLIRQAVHTAGATYQIQGTPGISNIAIVDVSKSGVIYLSVSVHGTWIYSLSPQQINAWPQYIKGATSAAALAYLNTQPGVSGVEIHLPFGADHLPTSTNEIRIILENNNTPST